MNTNNGVTTEISMSVGDRYTVMVPRHVAVTIFPTSLYSPERRLGEYRAKKRTWYARRRPEHWYERAGTARKKEKPTMHRSTSLYKLWRNCRRM